MKRILPTTLLIAENTLAGASEVCGFGGGVAVLTADNSFYRQ